MTSAGPYWPGDLKSDMAEGSLIDVVHHAVDVTGISPVRLDDKDGATLR